MKRKFLSVMMFAAITFGAAGTFTSCKDYDDDIDGLQEQVTTNKDAAEKAIKDLDSKLATLKGDLEAKDKALEDALGNVRKDVEAAQKAADEAKEAAANAKKEAIEEAQRKINEAKSALEGKIAEEKAELVKLLAEKVDKTVFDAKVAEFNKSINDLNTEVTKINAAITALSEDIATLTENVGKYKKELEALINDNKTSIQNNADSIGVVADNLNKAVLALNEKIAQQEIALKHYTDEAKAEVEKQISDLKVIVNKNTADIAKNAEAIAKNAEGIQSNLELINLLTARVEKNEGDIEQINKDIKALQEEDIRLAQLIQANADDIADLQLDVKELQEKMAAAEQAIIKLNEDLNLLRDRVESLINAVSNRLTSITMRPDAYVAGVPSLIFNTLGYQPITNDATHENMTLLEFYAEKNYFAYGEGNADADDIIAYLPYAHDYLKSASEEATVRYRLNPQSVGEGCADFSFVNDNVKEYFGSDVAYWPTHWLNFAKTRAELPMIQIKDKKFENGTVTFTVKKNKNFEYGQNEGSNMTIVALEAKLKEGLTETELKHGTDVRLYSENMRAVDNMIHQIQLTIADPRGAENGRFPKMNPDDFKFPEIMSRINIDKVKDIIVNILGYSHHWAYTFNQAVETQKEGIPMIYNKDFDIKPYVTACLARALYPGLDAKKQQYVHEVFDLDRFGLKFRYSVAENSYEIDDDNTGNPTNQQDVLQCINKNEGIFRVQDGPDGEKYNREAIGRKPIVKVEIVDAEGNVVRQAFIKLFVTVDRLAEVNTGVQHFDRDMKCNGVYTGKLDVEFFRQHILRAYNIAHDDLYTEYPEDAIEFQGVGTYKALWHVDENPNTSVIEWTVTNDQLSFSSFESQVAEAKIILHNVNDASQNPAQIIIPLHMLVKVPAEPIVGFSANKVKEQWLGEEIYTMNFNKPKNPKDVEENFFFTNNFLNAFRDIVERIHENFFGCDSKTWKIKDAGNFPGLSLVSNGNDGDWKIVLDEKAAGAEKTLALLNSNNLYVTLQRVVTVELGKKSFDFISYEYLCHIVRPLNLNLPDDLAVVGDIHNADEGSRVNFYYPGILTDWMGNAVYPASVIENGKETKHYLWAHECEGETTPVLQPAWQELITPEQLKIEFDTITLPAQQEKVEVFAGASINGKLHINYKASHSTKIDLTVTEDVNFNVTFDTPLHNLSDATIAAQEAYLDYCAQRYKAAPETKMHQIPDSPIQRTVKKINMNVNAAAYEYEKSVENVKIGEDITFTYVSNVIYTPAVYEHHDAKVIYPEHKCNEKPAFRGTELGQRNGCWVWRQTESTFEDVPVDGAFWDFYGLPEVADGKIIVLRTEEAEYLDGRSLPTDYKLTQEGNELVFKNLHGSTVSQKFVIRIPVTVAYKFGKLNEYLYLTVLPSVDKVPEVE